MTTQEYLDSNIRVCFTEDFPTVGKVGPEREYAGVCRKHQVKVMASLVNLSLEDGLGECLGVETSRVDISRHLPHNGFGRSCYEDEAKVMEQAVAQFCEEEGLTICRKVNSWPFAKAVVTKIPVAAGKEKAQ